ncbi:unnamed protein product [Sphagnum jensenii]|uniref:EF-hand domain-containing protein n=1 Tax=Sphagnum jensenii TaxID=128206 RepID=A0ABP0VF70_9BRYO
MFDFSRIAISSHLEQNISLEAVIPDDRLLCFELPPGPVTPYSADLVLALYRRRGKLTMDSLHKLLRIAYKRLKSMGNTSRVIVRPCDRVVVVGDLHGQLADLLHILEEAGLPTPLSGAPSKAPCDPGLPSTLALGKDGGAAASVAATVVPVPGCTKYIFNGDFVDRGPEGVEVTAVLLALFCAYPGAAVEAECRTKYDNLTFGMFVEVFQQLPLFTLIEEQVLILHGGLFHSPDATLKDMNSIKRDTFQLTDMHQDAVSTDVVPRYERAEFLRQMQRDALWSDPNPLPGWHLNPRGAGVGFGPDVTESFLRRNKLHMVVRSHECVRTGFDRPFADTPHEDLLCTVFSASNYYGAGNTAAYLVFERGSASAKDKSYYRVPSSELRYSVHYFITDGGDDEEDAKTVAPHDISSSLGQTLYDLVLSNKSALLTEFRRIDTAGSGRVSRTAWAEAMHRVARTQMQLQWLAMFPIIVPPDCCVQESEGPTAAVLVVYERFLDSFSATFDYEDFHAAQTSRILGGQGISPTGSAEFLVEADKLGLVSMHVAQRPVSGVLTGIDVDGALPMPTSPTGRAALSPSSSVKQLSSKVAGTSIKGKKIVSISQNDLNAMARSTSWSSSSTGGDMSPAAERRMMHSDSEGIKTTETIDGPRFKLNMAPGVSNTEGASVDIAPSSSNAGEASGEVNRAGGDYFIAGELSPGKDREDEVSEEEEEEQAQREYEDEVQISGSVVEALYSHHRLLETVFRFFDTDGTGTISHEEFRRGCEVLNSALPPEGRIQGIDQLLRVMDVSGTGEVDINEFFEMFRLSDAHLNISAKLGLVSAESPKSKTSTSFSGTVSEAVSPSSNTNVVP